MDALSVSAILFLLALFTTVLRAARQVPFPPGPKGWPIIGNALQMPTVRSWLTYMDWSRTYQSKILHARAFEQHIIILDDIEDAIELLEKRATIYSSRPMWPLMTLMGWTFISAFLPHGDVWRRHRRLHQQGFRKDVLDAYLSTLTAKSEELLRKLATTPQSFMQHAEVFAASAIMSIVYGYEFNSAEDPLFKLAQHVVGTASRALLPGVYAVNTFPILRYVPRWFPGGGFHDFAAECKKDTTEFKDKPYGAVKQGMRNGLDKPSLVRAMIEKYGGYNGENDDVLSCTAATSFAAGVDTTVTPIQTLFLVLTTFPEVQRRAQEEIARVIGDLRLPALEDRPSLPYIEATFREICRWRPPVPLGLPHAAIQDDVYHGRLIPNGSIVIANIWAMTHNESIYPEPDAFRPDCFLDSDGSLNEDDRVLAFGFGRRHVFSPLWQRLVMRSNTER